MKYAEVILPLPLAQTYTYAIPEGMASQVLPSGRVIVPFGAKRYYTAIVREVHERPPDDSYAVKSVFTVLDEAPVLHERQLHFWEWMASYYLCALGDVYKAAVPSGLKLGSETVVSLCDDFEASRPLSPKSQTLLDALAGEGKPQTVAEIEKKTGLHNLIPALTQLVKQGAITVREELKRGFVPKTEIYLRLSSLYEKEADIVSVFESLRRAPKQEKLLLSFLDETKPFRGEGTPEISRKTLLKTAGVDPSALNGLLRRGVIEAYRKEVSRLHLTSALHPLCPLSAAQQAAFTSINETFATKAVCLLHGAPSCGKTEIYLHLILATLREGRQVLYLLPEIAVTTQITERLARVLGQRLLVYHSGLSDAERVEVWNKLLEADEPLAVVGVRSSLFLPFSALGLVIVDEEQEPSYKQQDPAPRYHARNVAIMLASMHGARTLLGSATPSLDSFYNAKTGKYGLVTLRERYGSTLIPQIHIVDVKTLRRKKIMKETLFSPLLREKIDEALTHGRQVILFQNRRGFAPMLECKACGYVPHCVNCDVTLTYHRSRHRQVCHYCGYSQPVPSRCPSCASAEVKMVGFGTEKVEEEIATLFPDAATARLDLDNARTRRAYERILTDFEEGKTQILIGTQMLSKGLDFGNVSVVGVLNADSLMNFPDFRAHERAFQLMMQVSGRAGRRAGQGTVIIQTSQPQHPLLHMVQTFDYDGMALSQLTERKQYCYPPYCRLITVIMRAKNESTLNRFAAMYAERLRTDLGTNVIGPFVPPIGRVQTLFVRRIMLKIPLSVAVKDVRHTLEAAHAAMQQTPSFRQVILHADVDPQ